MVAAAPCTWLDDVRGIPRADWPVPTPEQLRSEVLPLHRGVHWALWPDGTVSSTLGLASAAQPGEVRPDGADLIEAVWHSGGHQDFRDWKLLARVERVLEREVLGVRWPRPWEDRLERLVVEMVDGSQRALFVRAVLTGERASSGVVTVSTTLPESVAASLDRPEPVIVYDLENPLHGTPRVRASAPRYVLVRPESRCVTAFHRRPVRKGVVPSPAYNRREHSSLRAVMSAHRLHPNQIRPVWPALDGVGLDTVAVVEAQRWNVKATPAHTATGVILWIEGTAYGPCGNPWDVANVLAARSATRRAPPVRARGGGKAVTRASAQARR